MNTQSYSKLIITVLIISIIGGFGGGFVAGTVFSNAGRVTLPQSGTATSTPPYVPITDDETITVSAVERVSPAVVSIVITKELSQFSNISGPNIFPFNDFFNFGFPFQLPEQQPQQKEKGKKQEVGGGSGFIVKPDGFIVTNRHVVEDEQADYTVILNDGRKFDATVLDKDPFNDLAMIKIDADNLPFVTLGDSDAIRIGQSVIAIGNTLGEYRNTVTKGVVSGINRRVVAGDGFGQSEVIEEAIQTDAAINPGNSGGPLINLDGKVVGVNTAISRAGQLVGFAIPINTAQQMIESVYTFGKIVRPWLGVRYTLNNARIAEENKLPVDYGAILLPGSSPEELAVIPGSPADKAGLEPNDIILEVDGQKIDESKSLGRIISRYKPGDTVTLTVLHDGDEKTVSVVLGEFDNEK